MAYPDDEDFDTMWERLLAETKGEITPHPMENLDSQDWDNCTRRIVRSYLDRDSKNKLLVGTPDFRPEDDFWEMVEKGEHDYIPDHILDEFRNNQ